MIARTVESKIHLWSQINLVLQIAILVILSASMRELKKKRNFFTHASSMAIAVVLNFLSLAVVMGPSLLNPQKFLVDNRLNARFMITIIHASLGAIAEVLGIWIVVSWRLQSSAKVCMKKRRMMQVTIALWIIALFSGLVIYGLLYI